MKLQKKMIILTILWMVLAVGAPSGLEANNHHNGANVDAIYQSIRDNGPLYEWDEEIVYLENEGMTLVCSLTIPRTQHLCPIVITMNGFAGDKNDVEIPGTGEPFFKRFARILAEQGFASLRLEFRGSGDSDGEYQVTSFSSQVSDALAAVDYIKNNLKYRVNTRSIGMMGFSQGGIVGSTAAAKNAHVDSLVLWSPVASPPHCYGNTNMLMEVGIKKGLALPDGGYDDFELYWEGQGTGWFIPLGKEFFEDLFNIDPVAEIRKYKDPLMVIVGKEDPIVWPQPANGQLYMKYHEGFEKLVVLEGDHAFNYWDGPEGPDTAFYWSTAWFIKTLK